MDDNIRGFIGIMLMLLCFCGMIYGVGYIMGKQKSEDIKQLTPECVNRCDKFDMIFYEMVNDGWLYECWCIDDNKPFKVGTLKNKG